MEKTQSEKEQEIAIEKSLLSKDFWGEYGKTCQYENLSSWRSLKMVRLIEAFISARKIYRKSLFTKESEQLQKDFLNILMATSIILALVLSSTLSSLGEITSMIHPSNMFQTSSEAFTYISKIMGFFSFASSAAGTFYTVAIYSSIACVPTLAFTSFVDAIGTYFGSITVKYILLNDLAIGITTIISAILVWGVALLSFAVTESLHGLAIIITARCKAEKA